MKIPKARKTGKKGEAMAEFFRIQAQKELARSKAEGRYVKTCRGCGSMGQCGCWNGIRRD